MLTASSPLTNIYSLNDDDHILRKLHPKGTWFLTVLGSLATTQREYVALHAFRRLNVQVTFFGIISFLYPDVFMFVWIMI